MRLISWLIALPFSLLAISFAASNLGDITLRLWPLALEWSVPVVAFAFILLLLGFILGASATWLSAGQVRARARKAERTTREQAQEISALEQKIGDASKKEIGPSDKTALPSS